MKTIRISDAAHRELTRLLGEEMAKTGKPQTYNDIIAALTAQSIIIPDELLERIDAAINVYKGLGCENREKFVEEAVTAMLQKLSNNHEKANSAKSL